MKVGKKAQGQEQYGKLCVARHTGAPRRGLNACEKALETRVRQASRREIRDQLK